MLTKIEDYRGYFSLAKNKHKDEDIQAYIDRFEVECLRELLQCEYDSFIVDLVDGLPQSTKWLDIYNPFYECLHCEDISSRGILDMIKCFVQLNVCSTLFALSWCLFEPQNKRLEKPGRSIQLSTCELLFETISYVGEMSIPNQLLLKIQPVENDALE